jgi:hypothetical protein
MPRNFGAFLMLTKQEAARRQLDCAIRLYFDNEDLLAVHALSRAAFRVLYDLHPSDDGHKALVTRTIDYLGWPSFNQVTNFLKHADKDPKGEIPEPIEEATQIGIGFAAMLYRRITSELTVEMRAFHIWMKVSNPEHFADVQEPDWEFEEDYRAANELLRASRRDVRMLSGKTLLTVLKEGEQT